MANGHADASPSAASIWLNCPASVTLTRGRVRKASPYTREGTAAHQVAELLVYGLGTPGSIDVEGEAVEVTDDMVEHVQVYLDYVDALRRKATWFDTETRVELDWLPEPIFGTADTVAVTEEDSTLEVVDLKFGKGVPIGAVNNPQLRIYGLGALNALDAIARQDVETVRLTIVQPRLSGGQPVQTEEIKTSELLAWSTDVLEPAVQKIADGDTTENPGAHCRWCVRAGECKALAGLAQLEAKSAFAVQPDQIVRGLSNDELANALDKAELIVSWVNLIRAEASQRADKGDVIPGWKLVPKRANRKWASEEDALDVVLGIWGLPAEETTKILSPAAIERVLKARKIDVNVLKPLVVRESSGSTLVREEDSRDGLALDAKSVFSAVA
jgi:hypothetical protein